MAKMSATVKAAWIAGGTAIGAAIIGIISAYVGKHEDKKESTVPQPEKVVQKVIGVQGPAVNNAGISAGRDVTTTINVGPKESADPEDGELFVDKVDILKPSSGASPRGLTLDISLRNPGTKPIGATGVIFRFDRELKEGLLPQDVREVTAVYILKIDKGQATAEGPVGRFEASAWYPSQGSRKLIVKGPISQMLSARSTDRVRVSIEFGTDVELRGPMKSLVVGIEYNGLNQAESKPLSIALPMVPQRNSPP